MPRMPPKRRKPVIPTSIGLGQDPKYVKYIRAGKHIRANQYLKRLVEKQQLSAKSPIGPSKVSSKLIQPTTSKPLTSKIISHKSPKMSTKKVIKKAEASELKRHLYSEVIIDRFQCFF